MLPPELIKFDEAKLLEIDDTMKSIYRLIVFDKAHRHSDLLTRYLEAMEHLRDVLSIKNAQQESQTHEEAVEYLYHLKDGLAMIVEEIAAQRTLGKPADLFMLLRKIAPEVAARTPNHFRQTMVQFGQSTGAAPNEIPGLVEAMFSALGEIPHPVVRAIYLHHEVVRIHPFTDGNGRLSRLAKNWLLMFDLYPPMFINDYHDKKQYISKLGGSFLALERNPGLFSADTRAFFDDELRRLKASAVFTLDRMLKNPTIEFDTSSKSLLND